MCEWRTTQTPPKEYEVVLTHHFDDLFPVAAFICGDEWIRETEGPEDECGPGKWEPLYRAPTHWQPLPEPPNV